MSDSCIIFKIDVQCTCKLTRWTPHYLRYLGGNLCMVVSCWRYIASHCAAVSLCLKFVTTWTINGPRSKGRPACLHLAGYTLQVKGRGCSYTNVVARQLTLLRFHCRVDISVFRMGALSWCDIQGIGWEGSQILNVFFKVIESPDLRDSLLSCLIDHLLPHVWFNFDGLWWWL